MADDDTAPYPNLKPKTGHPMSTFDPTSFINTVYEDAFQTKRVLVPVGTYIARIRGLPDVKLAKQPNSLMGKITFLILDTMLAQEMNRDEVLLYHTIFMDVAPGTYELLYGANQNLELGRLRSALGQNDPTQPWNFGRLENAGPLRIIVEHRALKDAQGNTTGEMIDSVAKFLPYSD